MKDKILSLIGSEGFSSDPNTFSESKSLKGTSFATPQAGGAPLLHNFLPYVSYCEESQLFFNTGSTGFALLGDPLAGSSLEVQDQLAEFFQQKDNLIEGASLQFLLHASPRIGEYLDRWSEARIPEYKNYGARRAAFLKEKRLANDLGTPLRDYRVLISLTVPGLLTKAYERETFIRIRNNLSSALKGVGMNTSILDANGLIREVGNIFNVNRSEHPESSSWNPLQPLSQQIFSREVPVEVEKERVLLKDISLKSYIPKDAPDVWSLPQMDLLLGDRSLNSSSIPCPFMIHYGFHVLPKQGKALLSQISKRGSLENSLKNSLTKWIPGLEEQFLETSAAVKELQRGERLVTSQVSVTLFCDRDKEEEQESRLKSIWSRAEWELEPVHYDHLNIFLASLPMTWTTGTKGLNNKQITGWGADLSSMGLTKKSVTKESQNLLPIVAEWKGQSAPGIPLYGRRGQVFFWNPFGEALLPGSKAQTSHNYNVCIAGQSGSGKSVFAQELMMNVLSVGGRVFVLDYGRSFKKACQLMKGQYIEFDVRTPMSLNPFTHIPTGNSAEDQETRQDMLACLKPTLQAMAAPTGGTTDLQNSYLEQALHHVWKKAQTKANIQMIQDFLKNHEDREARQLGQMIYPFTPSSGSYGQFFEGPAEAQLTEDFVVIETDNLRQHPALLKVLIQMVIIHIHQTMAQGKRDRPTLIMIDEAWKMLEGKSTGAFVAELNRVSRKYKVSIVLATQQMTDFFKPESPAAKEAFDTSAWKVMLYQEEDVITAFHNHDQLKTFIENPHQEKIVKSLWSEVPHYSEAAIYGPKVKGAVGRLSLDAYSRLLYSTHASEFQALENLTKQGLSIHEAIESYLLTQEGGT